MFLHFKKPFYASKQHYYTLFLFYKNNVFSKISHMEFIMNDNENITFLNDEEFEQLYMKVEENYNKKKEEIDNFFINAIKIKRDDDLEKQLIETHSAIIRITDILYKEKVFLDKLKLKMERVKSEEMEKAKQQPYMFKSVGEMEKYIIRSAKVTKYKVLVDVQESFVDYIENIFEILKSKKFDIKNIVEIRKADKY